ncbi:NYN domain-containing protein [Micromonospora chalcea]
MASKTPSQPVLFVYVDNSNVWIEGQRIQAVRQGLAADLADAQRRQVAAQWHYDFGRLYELACPSTAHIGRSILFGSRPPADDSLWNIAKREGFQVITYDRNAANKEKQVDISLSTTMMEDSYEHMKLSRRDIAVLVGGDGDFVPTVKSLKRRGFGVRVVFWSHAVSRELRESADEFVVLDPHFEALTRAETAQL